MLLLTDSIDQQQFFGDISFDFNEADIDDDEFECWDKSLDSDDSSLGL